MTRKGTYLIVLVKNENLTEEIRKLSRSGILTGELRIDDGRVITADQRKKIYATLFDLSEFTGYKIKEMKDVMKHLYITDTGEKYFSLSNCSVTTARDFMSYILDKAIELGVPLRDVGINRADDIDRYLYSCLKHRSCAICGESGEVHHWDAIGAGRDRRKVDDSGLQKICLCRIHHTEAHTTGRDSFGQKHHVYGIIYEE